ncbi:MAG: BamA/TamA family outer membrane protein [Leptolyngbyaceae cyanobacterium bins.59]|nr:BamA/TamA family outer membrane protein [Leptolyngbyaceae cyanobacterium bins.59]
MACQVGVWNQWVIGNWGWIRAAAMGLLVIAGSPPIATLAFETDVQYYQYQTQVPQSIPNSNPTRNPFPAPVYDRGLPRPALQIVLPTDLIRPGTPALPSPPPFGSPDLVVIVSAIEVLGADRALLEKARAPIRTRAGGETSQRQLQQDRDAILATGLFSEVTLQTVGTPNGLRVTFLVEPIVVQEVALVNAQVLPPTVATELFRPQLGATLNLDTLYRSAQQINEWYAQNGYSLARVAAIRPQRNGMIQVEVIEGVVAAVQVRFVNPNGEPTDKTGEPIPHRTQDAFIQRQVLLKPGDVYREERVRQDVQRLNQLGFLEQTTVTLAGEADRVVVNYDVIERPATSVNFGGGSNEVSGVYGAIGYRDVNIGGLGQQLAIDVQLGQRDNQFSTSFTSPYRATEPETWGYRIEGFNRRGLSEVFDDRIRLANGEKVQEDRVGGGVSANRAIGADWDATVGLNYTRTRLRGGGDQVFGVDERGGPLTFSGTGIDDLTTLSLSLIQDRRDNPTNTKRGSLLSFRTEQSLPIGLGSITMNRLQANYIQYIPVEFLRSGSAPEVVAFNLQGGTTLGDLPPYRAFNLGGPDSVRGYDPNRVASGRSYVLASAEYRFPFFDTPVFGVFFADFASDLGSGRAVLGQPAIVRGKPGTGFGYGAGLRVESPIGILRAEFGFNDQGESRIQVGIGQRY